MGDYDVVLTTGHGKKTYGLARLAHEVPGVSTYVLVEDPEGEAIMIDQVRVTIDYRRAECGEPESYDIHLIELLLETVPPFDKRMH